MTVILARYVVVFPNSCTKLAGGFKIVGELKAYFFKRFRGVMFLTLKNSSKTNSPVPPWALERIRTAFNVQGAQEVPGAGGASGLITPKP